MYIEFHLIHLMVINAATAYKNNVQSKYNNFNVLSYSFLSLYKHAYSVYINVRLEQRSVIRTNQYTLVSPESDKFSNYYYSFKSLPIEHIDYK